MGLRRPSRQIEVFDISLMAVVTKAMGAFLVLFVLMLPYYRSDPAVDDTSAAAREEIAKLRREIEELTRQIGENSPDAEALQKTISRMNQALSDESDTIDRLSKQANALSSQLQQARSTLEQARVQAASAQALAGQSQVAEAEMEVVANQNLKALRAESVAEADMEVEANQAIAQEHQRLAAHADADQEKSALMAVIRHAVFQPRLLLAYAWTAQPDCAMKAVEVASFGADGKTLPEGVNLKPIGEDGTSLAKRSDGLVASFPLGAAKPGETRQSLSVQAFWRTDELRTLTYASVKPPATAPCHIRLSTTVYDLESRTSRHLDQADVEVAAGSPYTLLNGIDLSQSGSRISTPTQADKALWRGGKAILRKTNSPTAQSP